MHLIARQLSKATNIPWVADFRDPWTKMFYFKHLCLCKWAEKKHHRLEQEVLDDATVVVAVSPLVQEEFQTMTDTSVELITNGFDDDDFDQVVEPDGYFNITHTGLFASDGNPEVLWQALAEKCQSDPDFDKLLRVRLVGKTDKEIIDSINAAGLGKHLINLGYQDHNIAVREQKNASLLILPLRKEPEYRATLPGKLFEYLASMNPILGIGQTDGAMARIVNQTGAGVVFGWEDKASVTAYLNLCWKRFNAADDDEDIQVEHSGETELKEVLADNVVGIEDYLLSVISSEMKATASLEFLKAHAVISRSWLMARIQERRDNVHSSGSSVKEDRIVDGNYHLVKWFGRDDHKAFDVCADDHCQRYQGLTVAVGDNVRKAVDQTWGEVLTYDGEICDARFSKCCGGMMPC